MRLSLLAFAANLLASESIVDRIIWTSEPYESLYFEYADNNYSLYKNEPGLIEFIKESVCNLECNETNGPCLFNNYLPAYYNEDLCTIIEEYGVSREEWNKKRAMEELGDWLIARLLTRINILQSEIYNITDLRDGVLTFPSRELTSEEVNNAYNIALEKIVEDVESYDFAVRSVCDKKCSLNTKLDYDKLDAVNYWYDNCHKVIVPEENITLTMLYDKDRCEVIKYFENNDEKEPNNTLYIVISSIIAALMIGIVIGCLIIRRKNRSNHSENSE